GRARSFQRKGRRRLFSMATMGGSEAFASVEGGLATSRGHCALVPARSWRRRRSTVRGGMRGDGHEVPILIRLGDGDRAGRGPSKVSTTIIRPPQHGQRRKDEAGSADRSRRDYTLNSTTRGPTNWVQFTEPHLTGSSPAFSATLTTTAFDRRSLRWFGACS